MVTTLVDVAPLVQVGDSSAETVIALCGVDVANANQHRVFRRYFRRIAQNAGERLGAQSEKSRQRHAMNIARGRGLR